MANLKARVAEGKCVLCWQQITPERALTRPTLWFQGEIYHKECWEGRFKKVKKADTKKAKTKRSF